MARFAATERDLAAISETFRSYILSWRRHLLAENKAPRTVQTYLESVNRFAAFLAVQGMPTDPTLVAREHFEHFIADLLTRHKPATASNRIRALGTFFRWLVTGCTKCYESGRKPPVWASSIPINSGTRSPIRGLPMAATKGT